MYIVCPHSVVYDAHFINPAQNNQHKNIHVTVLLNKISHADVMLI